MRKSPHKHLISQPCGRLLPLKGKPLAAQPLSLPLEGKVPSGSEADEVETDSHVTSVSTGSSE